MKNKFVAIFAALFMFAGLNIAIAAPANAHISSCYVAAYAPTKSTSTTLVGRVRWDCGLNSHHDFSNVKIQIQYKVPVKFMPDGWAIIPPGSNFNTTRRISSGRTGVYCANGTKTYRTVFIFDMYGAHGIVRKTARSGETTKSC